MGKGWWPVRKVMGFLHYSRDTIRDLVERGELEAIKGCGSQGMRISVESLEAFLERHRVEVGGKK